MYVEFDLLFNFYFIFFFLSFYSTDIIKLNPILYYVSCAISRKIGFVCAMHVLISSQFFFFCSNICNVIVSTQITRIELNRCILYNLATSVVTAITIIQLISAFGILVFGIEKVDTLHFYRLIGKWLG